ncbi:hypothetical protein [Mycoplasma nasistruthionis]|uniref:Uncharacterized protein n=1 Tax=Mycoplasma nasistruthionis TaxID=353852 RepID=A0A4Y6I6E3_9MOLU|nr:hypothetical protein [Mycoplasma nasistruthionis]QDF64880.1 hypothetical protein FIV53_00940 [Mycoplasma nasistruthionis]
MVAQSATDAIYSNDHEFSFLSAGEAKEQVVVIYDANVVEPKAFKNQNVGLSFKDKINTFKRLVPTA